MKCKCCNLDMYSMEEYKRLTPVQQGYVIYMQAAHDGSPLRDVVNDYPKDSEEFKQWCRGSMLAVQHVVDGEE